MEGEVEVPVADGGLGDRIAEGGVEEVPHAIADEIIATSATMPSSGA